MYQLNQIHMSENQWWRWVGRLENDAVGHPEELALERKAKPINNRLVSFHFRALKVQSFRCARLDRPAALTIRVRRQGHLTPMRWFVEKMCHFSHLKKGALDSCERQKLEEDGSWTRARTLVARSLRRLEFRQRERRVLVIRYPEKWCICKECPKGAAVQLEEGSVSLSQNTRSLRSQKKWQWSQSWKAASSTTSRFTEVGQSGAFKAKVRVQPFHE